MQEALTNITNTTIDQPNPAVAFGYCSELSRARNMNDLKRRICNIIKRLEFTDFSFVQLARADIPQPALCTIPTNLIRTYFDNSFFVHDMTLQKSIDCTEPFFQSTINDYVSEAPFVSEMTLGMERIYKLHKSYGYYDYYHVPIKLNSDSDPVLLSVTQRGTSPIELRHHVAGCESAIALLCEAINFVIIKHFRKCCYSNRKNTTINPKPLRVLETLANNDLTIEQVADKLCISVVTANQHLKTVRNSLGTRTNYAAIKQAVLEKLIRLDNISETTIEHESSG